jgi:hypothetical protein
MKTRELLSGFLFAVALTASSSVLAQVKIGSNPTTIGANSNLEIEATNARKVIINKTDGTLTIQNTPVGIGSDSLLTVNASGLVHSIPSSAFKQNLGISGAFRVARNLSNQTIGQNTTAVSLYDTESYDENNEMDPATGIFTVSQTGTWMLQGKAIYTVNTGSNSITMLLEASTDGGVTWERQTSYHQGDYGTGSSYTLSVNFLEYVTAGTKFRITNRTCTGCTTTAYVLSKQSFIGVRIR